METLCGKKHQYTDFELNFAKDNNIITVTDKHKIKLQQYMNVEALLNKKEHCVYREILNDYCGTDNSVNLHSLFEFNKELVTEWFSILTRCDPKIRTLVFYGKSNTGKSLVANALLAPFSPAYIQRDGGTNVHWLEHLHYKNVVLWEEPSIHMTNVEDAKLILGGENIIINRKNKNLIERPKGPAVVITTNREFWEYDQALLSRIYIYDFKTLVNSRITTFIESTSIVKYLCDVYDGRFDK